MTSRTDRPPAPLLALAAVAVALVLVTGGVVVAGWAGRVGGPAPAGDPGDGAAAVQLVRGGEHDAAVLEVGDGWTLRPRGTSLFYTDAQGRISAGIDGAAVFRDGFCEADGPGAPGRPSNRAIAGFGRVSRLAPRATSRELARQWRDAVAYDHRTATTHETGPLRTREVELADGSAAVRTDVALRVADPGVCEAARVQISVVSLDTGRWTSSVVLVRDRGVPDALGDAAADRLLGSLRPTSGEPAQSLRSRT
ncbi:hypothetical protein BKA08_002022 [Nocardioides marinisabuli]|uniref:DUF8017 domain-containing protein n=1 Tax=Nocardioides marinisabuli TaxID=419476 RepID=A0A7Y9F1H4_9ACTN|nr:hypothetical protein [Nocardioides marinisabuli]NYD57784.1 hypothetical protein [Nocardioides marinisabuli]